MERRRLDLMDLASMLKNFSKLGNNTVRYSAIAQMRGDVRLNSIDESVVKILVT